MDDNLIIAFVRTKLALARWEAVGVVEAIKKIDAKTLATATAEQIAMLIEWPSAPQQLIEVLVSAGVLRRDSKQRMLFAEQGDRKAAPKSSTYPDDFERFWQIFPAIRKRQKQTAYRAWQRAITRADIDFIINAAKEYANSQLGRSEYAAMPSTWLNGSCWEDDRTSWHRVGSTRGKPSVPEKAVVGVNTPAWSGRPGGKLFTVE